VSDPSEGDGDPDEVPSEGSPDADEAERGTEKTEEPDLGEDDLAELDPDVVEKVAEETAGDDEGSDSGDGEDDARGDEGNSKGTSEGESGPFATSGEHTVGGIYCNALGAVATGTREKWGSGVDGDREEAIEEYASLAESLGLEGYVNEWYEQQGGTPEMSPGQGMVAMTGMFAVLVLMEDETMMDSAMDGGALAEVVA
jgi:hypothetical protein